MRRASLCFGLALCLLLVFSGALKAQTVPPIVNRPAATLLLPYFEVDLDNAQGMTTLFSINNASATAILAHVTLWTDLGVPVFGFNVYLTGYDLQTINLRDVLLGTAPRSASAGQDPGDLISPHGPISQDINFASCTGQLPPPPIPSYYLPYLRSALTGLPSSFHSGRCVSRNLGTPSLARGYVTVDTVNSCTLLLPSDPGYFGFTTTFQNALWGDYMYVNPSQDLAYGDPLVHIIADNGFPAPNPELTTPGQYTFYGRLTAWQATDRREPLATNFAARFVAPKDFKTVAKARRQATIPPSTDLIVWRDPKVASVSSVVCGSNPTWYPLQQEQVRAFNEQEGSEVPTVAGGALFPAATQRVSLATSAFPLTFSAGWVFLNLNTSVAAAGANPPEDPAAAQAWVTILHRVRQGANGGRYDVGYRAIRLDSAQTASHFTIF